MAFCRELRVLWPILSGLVVIQLALGVMVGFLERWPVGDAVYFTFVTGLMIGYGDLVPARLITRLIALVIGFVGILLTGLVAALGVRALQDTTSDRARR
jgi:ion channel